MNPFFNHKQKDIVKIGYMVLYCIGQIKINVENFPLFLIRGFEKI
jgi:hypothetical protein